MFKRSATNINSCHQQQRYPDPPQLTNFLKIFNLRPSSFLPFNQALLVFNATKKAGRIRLAMPEGLEQLEPPAFLMQRRGRSDLPEFLRLCQLRLICPYTRNFQMINWLRSGDRELLKLRRWFEISRMRESSAAYVEWGLSYFMVLGAYGV